MLVAAKRQTKTQCLRSRLSQIQSGCSKRPFHFHTPYENTKSMETLAIIFSHGNVYEKVFNLHYFFHGILDILSEKNG